jgi:hypothetical protein
MSRHVRKLQVLILFIFVFSLSGVLKAATPWFDEEALYYGIKINGVLCGYAQIDISPMDQDGKQLVLFEERIFVMQKALGMEFDSEITMIYHIDPQTDRFIYHENHVKQGQVEVDMTVYVEEDTVRISSSLSAEEKLVPLCPDVILDNPIYRSFLLKDFVEEGIEEKTYSFFEIRGGEVQRTTYTKIGAESIELAGKTYNALIVEGVNRDIGLKIKWWIDSENGKVLKLIPISNRVIYLADRSVIENIETADLDDTILSKANVTIADIPAISYMKVKVSIEPVGLWFTPESLNIPGQRFSGTVEDNLIEGEFEIEHPRYEGSNAPPFPTEFAADGSFEEFLLPEEYIESGDPVLVEKAREITAGSQDSWEAAKRISRWVAENIGYAIPGGGTARKTYDMKAGECGAHSFLVAAFCRAVGIPARVVWGCMYAPQNGGSFGQHGWNEIYMGDAGWIPVDATAYEVDFVDSGHIRFAVLQSPVVSFNPHKLEILDYRLLGDDEAATDSDGQNKYAAYVGKYDGQDSDLTLLVQGGSLALDIPNRMVLAFKDADEDGKWFCTMSNRLFLTFEESDAGDIELMQIHEIIHMPKKSDPEEINEEAPADLKPYLGVYNFAAMQADFTVLFEDGSFAIYNPLEQRTVKLKPTGETGRWVDEFDKNFIYFEADDDEQITSLVIDSVSRCARK